MDQSDVGMRSHPDRVEVQVGAQVGRYPTASQGVAEESIVLKGGEPSRTQGDSRRESSGPPEQGRASARTPREGLASIMRAMRIAIIGTRGVPASYGGFETFAEELGGRLVQRGHSVTVYGRSHFVPHGLREYRGMRLRVLPTIRHKYLDTVVHTALSTLDALPKRFDVVLICNNANAPFAALPRLAGSSVALNVDGLEWERRKWGRLGRLYYQMCAWLAPHLPVVLVSDAKTVADYYRDIRRATTVYIPYGTDAKQVEPGETLRLLGLAPRGYILYVSRLEPENNAHIVMQGYASAGIDLPLVVVGDAPYATEYKQFLARLASQTPGVSLVGSIFGSGYAELQSNAAIYVQATEVGGTHPALVEAMGRGVCVVANDVPEHREVLGDAGEYYRFNDTENLGLLLAQLTQDAGRRSALGRAARDRAQVLYSWDRVASSYEDLFTTMIQPR